MNLATTSLILLLPLAASTALAADDLYRSTMPNGDVRYGESPAPGAKSVRKIPAPPTSTGVSVVTPEDKARASQIQQQGGGVTVIPQAERPPTTAAQQGSGTTYGSGPGPLPKRSY
jgi:hypothetical protein